MTGKRFCCALLVMALLASATGCGQRTDRDPAPAPTLPPASVSWQAPEQDSLIGGGRIGTMYLPAQDELHLVPRSVTLEPADLNDTVETLVRMLLAVESDSQVNRLGGNRQLSLYGEHPVELSNQICTVNLGSSALQLSYRELYKVSVALATTLCELDEISFVNILVADQSVGLDITQSLAMGSLTAHPDENLPVLWEQMEAKRTPLGDDMSRTPMSSLATLYYPLQDGAGIACENRILTFEGQTPQQLAIGLLRALESAGSAAEGAGHIPAFSEMLLHEPLTSELEDGGRLITLSFRENIPELLAENRADLSCLLASVTYTLTTFIPGIAAVCVRIGDKPITELSNRTLGTTAVLGGLLRRAALQQYLRGKATLFFARGERLCGCETPVERQTADSPRAQLAALMEGPGLRELEDGITATLPETVREDDILGIAAEEDTLLVNLSESFRSEIQAAGPEAETLLCYSMVNTLCYNTGKKRICFFFEGSQQEYIAGRVYWAGCFLYNPGIEEEGLG